MSVQAGIWNRNGEPLDRETISTLNGSLESVPGDGMFAYASGRVTMLYRPFFTTRESRGECQPYYFGDQMVMTWDGRLDNREELIGQLGRCLKDDFTDVAIVAAAFERWGTECFERLIGDWALALWDPKQNHLFLARDYLGTRHLHYCLENERIVWSTTLASFIFSGRAFSLCDEYLAGYLILWPSADLTPYEEIRSVPPGHFVQISSSQVVIKPHWSLKVGTEIRYQKDAEYEEQFRHLFRQAVGRRLRADRTVLADLSGGLDSSSIVCMADDILQNPDCLDTFSISDRSEPDEEDFHYYTVVEQKRGRVGHRAEIRATGDSLLLDYKHFVPVPGFGEREEVKNIRKTLAQRHGYRVNLSGLGGDEMLGNTLDPSVQAATLLWACQIPAFLGCLRYWSFTLRRPWIQLLLDSASLLFPRSMRAGWSSQEIETWIAPRFAHNFSLKARQLSLSEGSLFWPPNFRDSFQTLANLSRQLNRNTPGVYEIRYPFLDRSLVEFLSYIPLDQLLRPHQRRSLMRRALAGLLPEKILTRASKSGLGRCFILVLQKHWAILDHALRSPVLASMGYIDPKRFREALCKARDGYVSSRFFRLLNCLSAELWLQQAVARGIVRTDR